MHESDAFVGFGGDDREYTVELDGGEQERAGAGEAEAVLAFGGPLVERPRRYEATPLADCLRPQLRFPRSSCASAVSMRVLNTAFGFLSGESPR